MLLQNQIKLWIWVRMLMLVGENYLLRSLSTTLLLLGWEFGAGKVVSVGNFKNFMATYFIHFHEYMQLIAQSIRSGLILDFWHAFELMIAKLFQEMFSMQIRPSKVLPSFFKTDLFGEREEIMLHPDLSPMPRITWMSGGLRAGLTLKAQTADFSQWSALWKEISDQVSNQGSVSLKPYSFSGSLDVIFACILNKKSVILDFILGLAIRNNQKPSKVTNTTINYEMKKYDNMF